MLFKGKILSGARICEPTGILKQAPGILKSKNSSISRANYYMINRKCNCKKRPAVAN